MVFGRSGDSDEFAFDFSSLEARMSQVKESEQLRSRRAASIVGCTTARVLGHPAAALRTSGAVGPDGGSADRFEAVTLAWVLVFDLDTDDETVYSLEMALVRSLAPTQTRAPTPLPPALSLSRALRRCERRTEAHVAWHLVGRAQRAPTLAVSRHRLWHYMI